MLSLDSEVQQKMDEIVYQTETEINNIKNEKEKLQAALNAAQVDIKSYSELKSLVDELQSLESAAKGEAEQLKDQRNKMVVIQETLENNLKSSRERELSLENELVKFKKMLDSNQLANNDEVGQSFDSIIEQAKVRTNELENQVKLLQSNVNDLILELDSKSSVEQKCKDQNMKLVRQLSENQTIQRAMLDENIKLHHLVAELEAKTKDIEVK